MINRLKSLKVKIALVLCTILCITPSLNASAVTGYSNFDKSFVFSRTQAEVAERFFNKWGYTCNVPLYTSFKKPDILAAIPNVTTFYVSGHGNVGRIIDGYSNRIYASEIDAASVGFYKFVYTDTCSTGTDGTVAAAFNITNGDGLNHAFLGWTKTITDSPWYYDFTYSLFNHLDSGKNLNDACWSAHIYSGVSGYKSYGKWDMTIR